MTLEQRITELIQEFRTAVYGEDVRRTYADIAQTVCIDAMKRVDRIEQQGEYAQQQGDYAKQQGDYAKSQGILAGKLTEESLHNISIKMQQIENEFGDIKDIINQTENGHLLLEIKLLLDDMYRICTDEDIDRIMDGTYVDEDDASSIFEACSEQDIDEIITDVYVEGDDSDTGITEREIQNIIDNSF